MKKNLVFVVLSVLAAVHTVRGQVTVAPTDNLQSLVKANPAGTTFVIKRGVHHDSVTAIKNGDTFTGEPGAIENGAKLLTGWSQVTIGGNQYWTTAGGTPLQSNPSDSRHCEEGYPGCFYPQDLYFNNATYTHVTSLASIAPGKWYYDFEGGDGGMANNIYLASSENPNAHTVELGTLQTLLQSDSAQNVTIQGLIWEKYAGGIQHGPVSMGRAGCSTCAASGWVIQNNEVRLNSKRGISIGATAGGTIQVLNNIVHHNGCLGIAGGKISNSLIRGNTVYANNTDRISGNFESGGIKIVISSNITMSYNTVHDDDGHGLWADLDAQHYTFDHNTVYNETGPGIHFEISNHAVITNNTVYGCEDQIQISSSSNAIVQGNTVVSGSRGASINVFYSASRDREHPSFTNPENISVTGNHITIESGQQAARVVDSSSPNVSSSLWVSRGMFDKNTYCVPSMPWAETSWVLGTGNRVSWTTWRSNGQDPGGTLTAASSCPSSVQRR